MIDPAMAQRSPRASARAAWRRVHLALGLMLGGFFVLLGLTGSLLVFYVDLDAWMHPAAQVGERAPLQAFTERLRAEFPSRNGPWRLELPADAQRPLTARYYKPVERAHRDFAPLLVTLDPVTAQVLRERFWGDDLLTFVYDLHYTLLLDRAGRWTVGALGLGLLCSVSSGLWLWWPRRGQWRRALRVKPRDGAARAVYDLHVAGGVYGAVLLLVLAITGAVLALPEFIE
ncbi:MAG: PepSY domain-containing protein, partial [Betaproteobacteria bacterium]|nr:PepSY domain-containing protein [Betaproteobacteria bacterium]